MSVIDQIRLPEVLPSLQEDIPPVKCIVWKGDNFETITFDNIYPFDTIDDIKRMICTYYKDNAFIPKFMFVGIQMDSESYIPIDYLWYPNGTNDPKMVYILKNPIKLETDMRFVSSNGSWASPNRESRGRSTIEQVFLKNRQIPVFHVYPLKYLLREYRGSTPISEEDWNKRFAPYFPDINAEGPYQADADDIEFSKKIHYFIEQRKKGLDVINKLLENNVDIPVGKLTGVRHIRLTWKKPVDGFEGCGYMFYRIPVTEKRPYLRLMPYEGSPITKLHVKGVLPIPSLEDPKVLEQWTKEVSPTYMVDFCSMKYVHRASMGITQPIYGTVRIFNDGTIDLILLPPKQIRKLDPVIDFRSFNATIKDVFKGLPQDPNNYELREISALFTLKTGIKSKKFNKSRLLKRLPYFQTFFQEIKPLPNESPIISLRYKAVSQYASEDKIFTYLTQYQTTKMLDGEFATLELINELQDEFQFSKKEAIALVAKWYEQRGTFTVQLPEDGEFSESFNPGIDIHIYGQHPSYYFHINRIDSINTYRRIYSLISLLLIEEDDYFNEIHSEEMVESEKVASEIEEETLIKEKKSPENAIPDWMANDPFADAVVNGQEIPDAMPNAMPNAMPDTKEEKEQKDEFKPRKRPQVEEVKVAEADEKLVNPKSWFIKKLQEIDPRLFSFKTEDTDDNGYSRKCAGYDDRQPSILSKDQYERMLDIYKDEIFFLEYPLEGEDEPTQPLGKEEYITVMKYGSDQDSINYYFCPQYYCLSDEILVRPKDFEATIDRDGNRKPPNTCPFCYGKLITDKKKAVRGYTVIKRKDKKGATYHSYIDFMSKTTHPEGFALPCCFLKQTTLRVKDKQYSHLLAFLQDKIEELDEEYEEEKYDELVYKTDEPIEYAGIFDTLHKKYIIESNKHPGAGICAIVPPNFDAFFRQDSGKNIIERVAIHLKLRNDAYGFLRIGTQNTHAESLLGVLAPLLYRNSIEDVRKRILEVVTPRIFLNSHFGNLVLEFYNPADTNAMPRTKDMLRSWASQNLGIVVNSTNLYALIRIYNSYNRFITFINDKSQRKDLRHLQPMLSEPNLFTTRGIQLIVMEDAAQVTIKCPTFGVSMDRHKNNDFAFISRSLKNVGSTDNKYARYELFLYTSNKPAKGSEQYIHQTIIRWDIASRKVWPDIVKNRIDEYMTQCQSRYRSIYTSHDIVNPMAMIPLSKAISQTINKPEGIVKDSYNHIVGVTFRSEAGSSKMVTLPVIDDGVISIQSAFTKNIYLDWEDYKAAPADDIISYYKEHLDPLFELYPGHKVEYIVKQRIDNKIIAIQLINGLYIPATKPKDETAIAEIPVVTVEQFEWSINKKIAGITSNWDSILKGPDCGSDSLLRKSTYTQFEELYQQFRLMVSNWITSNSAGSDIRKGIEDIIFNPDLPEYEKRKRLDIFISSTLISWFYKDQEKWESPVSFLRKDCRMIDSSESCTGNCFWKEDEGKCLLHVEETTELGERTVSTPELFTKRVIDELVRFPIRRKQLMKRDISKVSIIVEPIRQDDQYIIPESSLTWSNLLRLDWAKEIPEESTYYEEMSREATAANQQVLEGEMPPELEQILGNDTKIRLYPTRSLEGILGITLEELKIDNISDITKENLIRYVEHALKPIGVINIIRNDIQFVKPTGVFDSVTIIFISDVVGFLIEEEGNPTVKIASLPIELQEKYNNADIVKEKQIPERKVPIVIGQTPEINRIPLIASKASIPLVRKRPIIENAQSMRQQNVRVPRRAPIIESRRAPIVERVRNARTPRRTPMIEP